MVRCDKCSREGDPFVFCPSCFLPPHLGVSCEGARKKAQEQSNDTALMALRKAEGWRACPNCQVLNCGKANPDACDHVTCPHCKHEFCFICFANRKVIIAHGNH